MGINDTGTHLYFSTMINLLKRYQGENSIPSLAKFFDDVRDHCTVKGQEAPLVQRIALLERLIAESDTNEKLTSEGGDLYAECKTGHLVIADMTDPLLCKSDVNCIFQVFDCTLSHISCLRYSNAEFSVSSTMQFSI